MTQRFWDYTNWKMFHVSLVTNYCVSLLIWKQIKITQVVNTFLCVYRTYMCTRMNICLLEIKLVFDRMNMSCCQYWSRQFHYTMLIIYTTTVSITRLHAEDNDHDHSVRITHISPKIIIDENYYYVKYMLGTIYL